LTDQTSNATDPLDAADASDQRPHVNMLRELAALGWYVTSIRPDREAPFLWSVTIMRFDGNASISTTDIDPDEALDEALRYASVDDEPTYEVAHGAPAPEASVHVVASAERAAHLEAP
jgi:hypothetical protein